VCFGELLGGKSLTVSAQQAVGELTSEYPVVHPQSRAHPSGESELLGDDVDEALRAGRHQKDSVACGHVFTQDFNDLGKKPSTDSLIEGELGNPVKFLNPMPPNETQRALLNGGHPMVRFPTTFEMALFEYGGNHVGKSDEPVAPCFNSKQKNDRAGEESVVDIDKDQSGRRFAFRLL